MTAALVLAASAGALTGIVAGRLIASLLARIARRARAPAGGGALRRLLVRIGPAIAGLRLVDKLSPPGDLHSRIVAAGEPGGLEEREWIALKVGAGATVFALALPVALAAPGRLGLVVALAAPAAGFLVPDFWLARAARNRLEQARRALPDMLELMRVAVEAGMSPARALALVATRFDGPLAIEWRRVGASASLGTPLSEALVELGVRLPDSQIRSLTEALRGSARYGFSLGEALAQLASSARHNAHQQLRERAAKAGPKIQLVVALILVPSVLLVVAAGLVAQLGGAGLVAP